VSNIRANQSPYSCFIFPGLQWKVAPVCRRYKEKAIEHSSGRRQACNTPVVLARFLMFLDSLPALSSSVVARLLVGKAVLHACDISDLCMPHQSRDFHLCVQISEVSDTVRYQFSATRKPTDNPQKYVPDHLISNAARRRSLGTDNHR